jgi:hypothetical protein
MEEAATADVTARPLLFLLSGLSGSFERKRRAALQIGVRLAQLG